MKEGCREEGVATKVHGVKKGVASFFLNRFAQES